MSSYELGEFLKETIQKRNLKITEVAKRAKLSRESIYKLIRGDVREPDLSTLVRLSRALQVHPIILLRKLFEGWDFCCCEEAFPSKDLYGIGLVADVTFPDNSLVSAGSRFVKTWEVQNISRTEWAGRRFVCVDDQLELHCTRPDLTIPCERRGLVPASREIEIGNVMPEECIRVSVEFTAPSYPCSVISYWKMIDRDGNYCFPRQEELSCLVQVVAI